MSHSTNEVAIIGVGLHPFGRFEGKSAMQMASDAIGLALVAAFALIALLCFALIRQPA